MDSAVSALLLKQQGYDVHAIFMKNWEEDDGTEYCTAVEDYEDAQRIADKIDIPLHAINFAAEYWDSVFEEFLSEYSAGRTPNPDVLCNRFIKFEVFQDYVESRGLSEVATGHYASLREIDGKRRLFRASDSNKDQTYFLQAVPKERLQRCRFPLANLPKTEVRQLAENNGLHVFNKKDSTGICFIGERRFQDFLQRYLPTNPGPILDSHGERVGEHLGLSYYTLGQRQGLGIGGKKGREEAPWYVLEKHLESNELVVTQNERELENRALRASQLNLLHEDLPERCEAMIRYRSKPQPCSVTSHMGQVSVLFDQPQRAITPGQYIAFYSGEECLGGARIEQVGSEEH